MGLNILLRAMKDWKEFAKTTSRSNQQFLYCDAYLAGDREIQDYMAELLGPEDTPRNVQAHTVMDGFQQSVNVTYDNPVKEETEK